MPFKKRHRARLPTPIGRQGRALSLGRVGARNLAKSPRFSEPIGKKGVHKDGQHSMAAAILITGASRGLGFEFASQYSADGWRVFAACRSPAAATKLQRLAQDTEGMLKIVAMDVTDAESVQNATRLRPASRLKRFRGSLPPSRIITITTGATEPRKT
jgi:hypothetical protein